MAYNILAVNPGSTSTKVALYEDKKCLYKDTIRHDYDINATYETIMNELPERMKLIKEWIKSKGLSTSDLSAVVGRGGVLPPMKSGAYRVNEALLNRLRYNPEAPHASNMGGIISHAIAEPAGIPSFIYDSISVDEMDEVARVSGSPLISRRSHSHALNARAMARKVAEKLDCKYEEKNFIVAHLGGGISITAHRKGQMVDLIADDEGPFSPERAGMLPVREVVKTSYSGKYGEKELQSTFRGRGGMKAYLGTSDVEKAVEMAEKGDAGAKLVLEAMAYQIAKGIGDMAAVLKGDVVAIILTGGISNNTMITEYIRERVSFIAHVVVEPGEHELEALALGALRVIEGTEDAREYEE